MKTQRGPSLNSTVLLGKVPARSQGNAFTVLTHATSTTASLNKPGFVFGRVYVNYWYDKHCGTPSPPQHHLLMLSAGLQQPCAG